jgi:capsule polysaccharide export protein KpsC/LpsZ
MKILIDIKTRKQYNILNNFKIGVKKHGIHDNTIINSKKIKSNDLITIIKEHDFVVGWGVKSILYKLCNSYKKDFLVMERGYMLDRFYWTSCGFNGLNGDANFLNKQSDSNRWNDVFASKVDLKEYKKNGEYAVIAGQVKKDASIRHLSAYTIYSDLIYELNSLNIPVIFRPHPLEKSKFIPTKNNLKYEYDFNQSLNDTLLKARFTITINSNAGVVSLINGTPVITIDKKSMVYDYSTHSVFDNLMYPDRTQWCSNMAYTQWCPSEIKNGEMWNHLKKRYY